ncbi:TetR/AcrR family transcriptional regulator [Phenylobacterium aquaticum]|uniref:TetR/AcrR family transcriptional regulator n=1 Tax=Phenylobacterium aquaticum TaxID=1763816 RepID=UPI001F5CADA8|nr:TetR/AcrR family transcriptional regulator [Phenylobacterium aquaticum]MCI3131050.1 TetR/AcrR family transcriptional regulator [Phenylobacterium aquaticum]
MNKDPDRPAYNSPLRTRQKAQTSELIMEAVGATLAEGGLSAVTILAVARAAQVTDRTVYRHYSTRDEMIAAFLRWHLQRSGGEEINAPKTLDTYMATVRRVFAAWQADEAVVRSLYLSPEGREFRKSTTQERITIVRELVDAELPELSKTEREGLADAMGALAVSETFVLLRDVRGLDAAQAGAALTAAVDLMLSGARQKAAALRAGKA